MHLTTRDTQIDLLIVVPILAFAGIFALRGWLRVGVFVLGLLVVLYLLSQLGYQPAVHSDPVLTRSMRSRCRLRGFTPP